MLLAEPGGDVGQPLPAELQFPELVRQLGPQGHVDPADLAEDQALVPPGGVGADRLGHVRGGRPPLAPLGVQVVVDQVERVDRLGRQAGGHRFILLQPGLDQLAGLLDCLFGADQAVVGVFEQRVGQAGHPRAVLAGDGVGGLVELGLQLSDGPLHGPLVRHADQFLDLGEGLPQPGRVRLAGEPPALGERGGLRGERRFRRLAEDPLADLLESGDQVLRAELLRLPGAGPASP